MADPEFGIRRHATQRTQLGDRRTADGQRHRRRPSLSIALAGGLFHDDMPAGDPDPAARVAELRRAEAAGSVSQCEVIRRRLL